MAYQVIERTIDGWTVIVSEKTPDKARGKAVVVVRPRYQGSDGAKREVMGTKPVGHEYPDSIAVTLPGWPR